LLFGRCVLPAAIALELAPPVAGSLAFAIETFAETTTERLAATVIHEVTALREPRGVCPERALRLMPVLVDTLVGFAVGGAAADLVDRIRTAGPAIDRAWVRRRVGAIARRHQPDGTAHRPNAVLADRARRPLVDELGCQLLPAVMVGKDVLRRIAAEAAAASVPAHAIRVLSAKALCDAAALRLADQIEYGWATYIAALAGGDAPAIAHPHSREMWGGWLQSVRRVRAWVGGELGALVRAA
jgi:hypothetical protein